MRRWIPLAIAAFCLVAPFARLQASGDFGCATVWKLASSSYDTCGSRSMLAPGNDSRVNLFYLLRDAQGAAAAGLAYPKSDSDTGYGHSFFGWADLRRAFYPQEADLTDDDRAGSRCASLASGTEAFGAAMAAARGLPASEREALAQARNGLALRCGNPPGGSTPQAPVKSAAGRDFLTYLQAADGFYAGQWDAARDGFAKLRGSKDSWLAETAAYMAPRTELNAAQENSFDEWGALSLDKTDKVGLERAKAGFADYLKRYPQGRYAASAQGLIRRTFWLSGDATGLAREYERLLRVVPAADPGAANLVEEVDNKLLMGSDGQPARDKAVDQPLVLATIDLLLMRDVAADSALKPISTEQIAAQAPHFAGRADLYGFVQASHAYYVEKDMPKVLRLIPDDAKKPGYAPLAFSRQVLRGMALAATGDRNEAGFWRELMSGANALYQHPLLELALAMNYERSGHLADVYAPASPIREAPIREILLQYVAGPDLLRAEARAGQQPQHERDLALFTLLQKDLLYGDYAAFLRDSPMVGAAAKSDSGFWNVQAAADVPVGIFRAGTWSDDYACPALSATAATLARNPGDVKGRLCLGDFYRLNGFDGYAQALARPKRDELGGSPTQFPGKATSRGDIYTAIIADAKAPADDKAYALYRAINCYAPSGNNQCDNPDVAKSQRHAWFERLKHDHASSQWAQKLRYYW